jgi:hypothetical protein
MIGMTRSGMGPAALLVVLTAGLASACTAQVNGEARPDPAVTVASSSSVTAEPSPSSSSRSPSTSASASSARRTLCALVFPVMSSATEAVNAYLDVYNATKSVTPELTAAQQKAIAALKPVPSRLRSLPGLATLPSADVLTSEVPAIATAVESVLVAIPLQKAAPFNSATDNYNTHLDAIRSTCTP